MELGKITPKRIEIKAGMFYSDKRGHLFEIKSVNLESRAINIVNEHDIEDQFSPNSFLRYVEERGFEVVGQVEYKKRFLLKPKRIVKLFQ